MVDFLKNTLVVVNTDPELANNPMIKSVLENIQHKMAGFSDELSLIEELKVQLSSVNAYVKNEKLTQTISKLDTRIEEILSTSTEGRVRRMYDELGLVGIATKLKTCEAYKDPIVMNYVNKLIYEMEYSPRIPKFRFLPGLLSTLSNYTNDTLIKETVELVQNYIHKNHSKLIILETIQYLDGTAGTFYNATTDKLKKLIIENKISSDIVSLEMSDFANIPVVSEMINSIRSVENVKNPNFNLGTGDNGTQIFNYVGPVLKEGKGLVTYFNNTFVHITPEAMVKENYKRIVGKTGAITIAEYKDEYIKEHMSNFFNLAKAFDSMGFKLKDKGISSKMNRVKVDFKVNESNTLDVYINDSKIEDIKNLNANELFLMEHPRTKQTALNVFENMDNIFNVEFIKFLVNESTGKATLVINLKDDYHVYDLLGAGRTNNFKLDGYKLYKYVKENFKYDISKLFQIQINDTLGRAKSIQEKKVTIESEIKLLDQSLAKLTEAKLADEKKEYTSKLEILEEQINQKKHDFRNQYVALDVEMRKILEEDEFPAELESGDEGQDAQGEQQINVGDEVTMGEDEEGIVINKQGDELIINKDIANIVKETPDNVKLKDAQTDAQGEKKEDAQAQSVQESNMAPQIKAEVAQALGKAEEAIKAAVAKFKGNVPAEEINKLATDFRISTKKVQEIIQKVSAVKEGLAPEIKAEAVTARREKAIKAVSDKFKGNVPEEEVTKLSAELKISAQDVKKLIQKVSAVKESKINEDHLSTREEKIQFILSKSAEADPNSTLTADALSKLENNIIDIIYAGMEQQDGSDAMSMEIEQPVQAELGAQMGGVQGAQAAQGGIEMPVELNSQDTGSSQASQEAQEDETQSQDAAQDDEAQAQEEDAQAQDDEAQKDEGDEDKEKVEEKINYRLHEQQYSLINEAIKQTINR
jgi:hypothetical protein